MLAASKAASSLLAQTSTSGALVQDFAKAITSAARRGYHKNVSSRFASFCGPGAQSFACGLSEIQECMYLRLRSRRRGLLSRTGPGHLPGR